MTQQSITLRSSDDLKQALEGVSNAVEGFVDEMAYYAGSASFTAHELGVDLFDKLYHHANLDEIRQLVLDGTISRWITALVDNQAFADHVLSEFLHRLEGG